MNNANISKNSAAAAEAVVQGQCYRFTVLTDRLIRMEYHKDGRFIDSPTQTVICRQFPVPRFRVIDQPEQLEIVTDALHLYYNKKSFSGNGLSVQLHQGFAVYGSVWHYGDALNDLKGTARTLDNADGAIELESGLMSRDGFTVLDDSKSATINAEGWIESNQGDHCDLYFFGYGHDYLGCLKDFYKLSGHTPLLPKYALGNWWSRYYPYTQQEHRELLEKLLAHNIPISVAAIDMDWHLVHIPQKYGSGWTGYTWNPYYFPDPEAHMEKLHGMGIRCCLNVHPADGVKGHEKAYLEMAKELGVDYEKEDKIPFDVTSKAFMQAYFKHLHHPIEEQGVDFWWIDWQQGSQSAVPGIDPLWMLNHFHYLDNGRKGNSALILSRYAGIGSHRYPVGFSGDTICTWESLNFQPYFTATASNAGYTWWSHDIGGHQRGKKDDELMVRWVQLGVFSPIMRPHSTSNAFYGKEPWNYNLIAEKILTEQFRLRHKLIPYLHTMNYLTHKEGLPLVQPMYYHHDVGDAYAVPNQYYFGSSMIVCPITQKMNPDTMLSEVLAWLPEGTYFDFFGGQVYRGGRWLKLYRELENIPVLIPAGSIIPVAKDPMNSHLENPRELEVYIYNGDNGSFTLYEEKDGQEAFTEINHCWNEENTSVLNIAVSGAAQEVIPEERTYILRFCGFAPIEKVKGGTVICQNDKETVVQVSGQAGAAVTLQLTWSDRSIPKTDKKNWIYDRLHKAQISYDLKQQLYWLLCSEETIPRKLAQLQAMDLDGALLGALTECLTCDV